MNLPRGELLRKRVVSDVAAALRTALDREVTGYLRLSSQERLLLADDGVGVITLTEGVPVVAYHTGTQRGGATALGDMAIPGPFGMELYALDAGALCQIHDSAELRVPPGLPARQLAGDSELAARTADAAPADRETAAEPRPAGDAVEAFLEDEEKIRELKARARKEARERAAEWDL